MELFFSIWQMLQTQPVSEIIVGTNMVINAGAIVGFFLVRTEVKGLRKTIETLEGYILRQSFIERKCDGTHS